MAFLAAAVSAIGAITGGIAQGREASYQAQVARNNALIAQQNAEYAAKAGRAQSEAESLKGAALSGRLRAAMAANNVDVNSGSSELAQLSQRETNEQNTLTTANNAALQVYGYKTNATSYEAQAGLDEMQAKQAPIAGALGATGSLLSAAPTLGFKWQPAQNPTITGSEQ